MEYGTQGVTFVGKTRGTTNFTYSNHTHNSQKFKYKNYASIINYVMGHNDFSINNTTITVGGKNSALLRSAISIEGDIDELQFEIPEQKKIDLDKTSRKILEYLFEDKLKIVINDENFELNSVKKAILVLENYINFNLDTNINAKKMLWGALLW